MNNIILFSSIFVMVMFLSFSVDSAFAHPHLGQIMVNGHTHESQTEIIPLNDMMGLEKSTLLFHASEDNTLPWGFVEGKIANHVEGYPVIIQIFQNNDAVHFAQTDVGKDGTYEYKFRVLHSENGNTKKIFDDDYSVTIFKVVYLNQGIFV
ncbi:hypothetical protein AAA799E16_00218 [Marine Group I thaumarchaeote SCGC AAA799-E16]|uniref:Uncharacterized protein n=4 Tax=Marine Group I TaxID=905826 RepID=A0A087S8Y7_9ARCH|nr:hypothetical protein AAA799E16_00218 [Marine Group I thaumarchaeote SCGC AAA799-E16]KFM17266.1 hypothetical protein AAA799D11_00043 [Marine Group I thaumarchaeote SCGC AAA799-D11]KFM19477.1 hypothetical protein SCCGRSA3_00402 [Marine Group I thaumarchaeote SCGC RSA3]KFM22191.1 hypothetical protein AAA799B03_00228 [Marine Group I thaumarchaeote SCGC AAA799-B03]